MAIFCSFCKLLITALFPLLRKRSLFSHFLPLLSDAKGKVNKWPSSLIFSCIYLKENSCAKSVTEVYFR